MVYKKAFVPVLKNQFKTTIVPFNGGKIVPKLEKITHVEGLTKSTSLLKKIGLLATNKVGDIIIGHINNGINSVLNNSQENLPYVLKENSKNLLLGNTEDNTRVFYIKFHVGFSSTKSVIAAENQYGSSKLELTNSLSDSIDTNSRSFLAKSFGFNEKRVDFLGSKFFGTVSDYNKIYNILDWKPEEYSIEVPYGLVKEEQNFLKIRNSNAYHAIRIKLHLVKILDDDVDMISLYRKTFNKYFNNQETGTIPSLYQISDRDLESNDFMLSMLSYSGMNVNMSSNFKVQAKIVKTFSKTLDPGDTLDFKMVHHCGPGIRFDIAQSFLIHGTAKGNQPSSYGIIVEATGTPCEGVRFSDNSIFQGTSPGYYNYEFRKVIVAVKHSNLVGDVGSIGDSKLPKKFAIKVYEKEQLKVRPFHMSIDTIGDRNESTKTFGVLSTSAEKPVYSQNVVSGDREESKIKELKEDLNEVEEW